MALSRKLGEYVARTRSCVAGLPTLTDVIDFNFVAHLKILFKNVVLYNNIKMHTIVLRLASYFISFGSLCITIESLKVL